MSLSILLACLWALAAVVAAMAPERLHWPAAWMLIAAGIPLLGLLTLEAGPVFGLGGLVAAVLLLSRSLGHPQPGET